MHLLLLAVLLLLLRFLTPPVTGLQPVHLINATSDACGMYMAWTQLCAGQHSPEQLDLRNNLFPVLLVKHFLSLKLLRLKLPLCLTKDCPGCCLGLWFLGFSSACSRLALQACLPKPASLHHA